MDRLPRFSDRPRSYVIPTIVRVRPCREIAPEASTHDSTILSLADRYDALTRELPLAGGPMLRSQADGEILLTRHLRAAAPWLEPAIALIDRELRVQNWAGRPWIAWRPICLVGRPGTGKSHLARLIGQLAGTGHATLDLGGTSDNRTLEGTARGWLSAQPCWPATVMNQTHTANPVLVLEEVEKAGGSPQNGVPHSTLLTMIERETAASYWDKCLLTRVDLSHACWILTCNEADLLPAPLRSRLDIVTVDGRGPEHFDHLVGTIIANLARQWDVPLTIIPDVPPRARRILLNAFTADRSVRRLHRRLEQIIATMIPHERGRPH